MSSLETNPSLFKAYLHHLIKEVARLEKNSVFFAMLEHLRVARRERRTVFLCGNGGSAANANHFATDLLFGLKKDPRSHLENCLPFRKQLFADLPGERHRIRKHLFEAAGGHRNQGGSSACLLGERQLPEHSASTGDRQGDGHHQFGISWI